MKYPIIGMLLIVLTASFAVAQTDTTQTTPPTGTPPAAAPASDAVKRAVVCSAVAEREPADTLTTVPATTEKVCFFTEIIGMEGKTITHRWVRDGQTAADVPISVGGSRWRCYSTKTVAGMAGAWTVQVLDDAGNTIGEASFTVSAQ